MKESLMRIGELAKAAGTPVRTIRYYEEIGLLPQAERTESGYRVFATHHLRQLRFVRAASSLGLSLAQVREILNAASLDEPPCGCVRDTLKRNIEEIDERIAALQTMRGDLARTLDRVEQPGGSAHEKQAMFCPAIESIEPTNRHLPLDSPVDWRV